MTVAYLSTPNFLINSRAATLLVALLPLTRRAISQWLFLGMVVVNVIPVLGLDVFSFTGQNGGGLDQRLRSVPTGGYVDFILVEVAENATDRWPERKYSAPELADYRLAFTSSPRGPVHLYRQTPATR